MVARHPMRAVATLVALAYGAAVVAACGALLESGLRYHGSPERYAGSSLVVATTDLRVVKGAGPNREVSNAPLPEIGRVDVDLAGRIAALPGVRSVVADTAIPLDVLLPTGAGSGESATGHAWAAAALGRFALLTGRPPVAPGDVVLDARLARTSGARLGQTVRLVTPAGVVPFTLTGIADPPRPSIGAATVFLSDSDAQSMIGHPGTADLLGIVAGPGVDTRALASAVRGVLPHSGSKTGAFSRVYAGADRGLVGSPAAENGREFLIATAASFGGFTLAVAMLVIAGTVGLTVAQRHRDIALLRAIAATPSQVRRMIVTETLLLAVAGGAAGAFGGVAAVGWVRSQLIARGLIPPSFRIHTSWLPWTGAVIAVTIVALPAAWVASIRASRIRPTQALREAAIEQHTLTSVLRLALGVAALAGGVALVAVSDHLSASAAVGTSIGMVATFVIAVAFLAPWITLACAKACGAGLRCLGAPGRLAAANLAASARRLSPVLTSLVLAIALGGSLWFMQTSIQHTAVAQSRSGLLADQVISTSGPGIPPGVATLLRQVPGVGAVTPLVRGSLLDSEGDSYTAEGVDSDALVSTIDLGVTSGLLAQLGPGTVAVDTVTAADLDLGIGKQFRGWFGDGASTDLRVVAIYRRGLGFADFTLPVDVLRPHTTSGLDDIVLVSDVPGRAGVSLAISSSLRGSDPGATVMTSGAYQAVVGTAIAQNIWTVHTIVTILLVYVAIAALNTLATAAFARRRELAILRLAGLTRAELLGMVRIEQFVILGLSLAIGGAIATVTLVAMVTGATGTATPYIPLSGWVAVIMGPMFLAAAGTLLPILRIIRLPTAESIDATE